MRLFIFLFSFVNLQFILCSYRTKQFMKRPIDVGVLSEISKKPFGKTEVAYNIRYISAPYQLAIITEITKGFFWIFPTIYNYQIVIQLDDHTRCRDFFTYHRTHVCESIWVPTLFFSTKVICFLVCCLRLMHILSSRYIWNIRRNGQHRTKNARI